MTAARKTDPGASIAVGVSDHAGWAVLVTVDASGTAIDRRRVELVEPDLPPMPHHHEGQRLPTSEAVQLVERVTASAVRCARARLEELCAERDAALSAIALRACPPLPPTIAERIASYRAMCVADWVMYRTALADAATERGRRGALVRSEGGARGRRRGSHAARHRRGAAALRPSVAEGARDGDGRSTGRRPRPLSPPRAQPAPRRLASARYASRAASCVMPFLPFHASHFARPRTSSMPGRLVVTSPAEPCL